MTEANLKLHSVRRSAKFALDVISGTLGMLSYIVFFSLAGIILLVGIDTIGQTSEKSISLIITFIVATLFFFLAGWSIRHLVVASGSFKSKLNTIKWTIVHWWGILFRTVFVSSIGFSGYLFYKPIGDIPFSQLTLNQVFGNLFATVVVLGSLYWFFNFPNEKKRAKLDPSSRPYYLWGAFGTLVVLISSLIAGIYTVWLT